MIIREKTIYWTIFMLFMKISYRNSTRVVGIMKSVPPIQFVRCVHQLMILYQFISDFTNFFVPILFWVQPKRREKKVAEAVAKPKTKWVQINWENH